MTEKLYTQSDMEALRERCAKVADDLGDKIMVAADKAHEDGDYDLYEALEDRATVASKIGRQVRALPIHPEGEKP